ncbi:hypothetical protein KUCAC02_009674 [Chaenocephalus aceratus]|nr:hypothetical protein KUCAC02_032298 [Chaenocephalus aceratus]KAI4800446.1 hypothetical protein KUCAC02_009674 [Chaenocephalus aceratus]
MPRGSTNTTCVSCKEVIAVSTKTCKFCKTLQPRKQRLAKKLQRFEAKKDDLLRNGTPVGIGPRCSSQTQGKAFHLEDTCCTSEMASVGPGCKVLSPDEGVI